MRRLVYEYKYTYSQFCTHALRGVRVHNYDETDMPITKVFIGEYLHKLTEKASFSI